MLTQWMMGPMEWARILVEGRMAIFDFIDASDGQVVFRIAIWKETLPCIMNLECCRALETPDNIESDMGSRSRSLDDQSRSGRWREVLPR